MTNASPKAAIVDALAKAERVLVAMHAAPDGDSAGSGLALGQALSRMGKSVTYVSKDGIPDRIAFLPGADMVQDWDAVVGQHFDVVVSVDCGHQSRLGAPESFWQQNLLLINIDHHAQNPRFGHMNWIDGSMSSTGEMICELFWEAGWPVNTDQALCLYTAISTDTLSFRQRNTVTNTFKAATWLATAGLDLARANRLIWDSRPIEELRFLGWALGAAEVSSDGRVAWLAVPRQIMHRYGVDDAAVDTVVQHLMSIDSVEVAFLARESEDGSQAKVSWRGRANWDVSQFAACFGGGGHPYAAAAQINGELDTVLTQVLGELGVG
ncbi:DHH family phosphoesterase [Sulfobacillus harzensis]|uniref:Bifunctional oligoribonuclease/PAP phosphatase NrnA n=1 Tax=Sulfobacillus harzensis TaxID=2729629 RepID=A0A7Y0L207_9FIRM|nr:bifunctional oligoribonuclease/PAP phosphatase NrnA [Sulfobacillus harzensis]NMP21833.1 bifunctional oligoribonuclease/PAP phosphatase NrnA [Sulfobacillus harzensis]